MESTFIASVGNETSPIYISKLINKDKTYVDIRKMYQDKDGEIKHTKKGIAILDEDLFDVMKVLVQFLEVDEQDSLMEELQKLSGDDEDGSDLDGDVDFDDEDEDIEEE